MVVRGELYLLSLSGDFGKTRPVAVIQDNDSNAVLDTVTVCLLTSHMTPNALLRIDIAPTDQNGLKRHSQVQADKIQTARKEKLKGPIGRLDDETMNDIDMALALHLRLSVSGRELGREST